jgi:hypothetical protein
MALIIHDIPRTLAQGVDSKGCRLALIDNGDGSFCVLVKTGRFDEKGGIAWTWRPAGGNARLYRAHAEALFERRVIARRW